MFIHKNGRLYVGATSFVLPHECIIDTLLPVESHNGLIIKPTNQEFQICIDFSPDTLGAKKGLKHLIKDWTKPAEILQEEYSCGTGWSISYSNNGHGYHDLRFDMSAPIADEEGRLLKTVELLTCVKSEEEVHRAIKSVFFMELVDSLEL